MSEWETELEQAGASKRAGALAADAPEEGGRRSSPAGVQRQAALSQWWSDRSVQRKGPGDVTAGVHEAAAAGVAGSGGRLPHLQRIQESFGRHDVSAVQSYVGGQARRASESIGAEAYATGDRVAFRDSPSLHTAAHEAAHVVQQRGGVQLKGGVGAAGDRYERHADAVADAVVAGKSAEGLLDPYAGGAGGPAVQQKASRDAAVQRENEPKGAWNQQFTLTKDSFFDLVLKNKAAADAWFDKAKGEEPPPAWQTALSVVGGIVLNAALAGVGGALAAKLTKDVVFAANAAIRTAIAAGQDSVKKGVGAAISAAGTGREAAVKAYCHNQAFALLDAAKGAREGFVKSAGNFDDQKLTIAQMQNIKTTNDQANAKAMELQSREMLVGWMGMLAGDTSQKPPDSDVEDIDQEGVLRVTVTGSADKPNKIVSAQAAGLNPSLRASLKGQKVGTMRKGGKVGKKTRTHGIDILVTAKPNQYIVTDATWKRLQDAGKVPSTWTTAGKNHAIWFSIFGERGGNYYWADTDMNWSHDFNWGADAGRWFLDNVRNGGLILADLDNLTLPAVST